MCGLMQGLLGPRCGFWAYALDFSRPRLGLWHGLFSGPLHVLRQGFKAFWVIFGGPDSPISEEETARDIDGSAAGQRVKARVIVSRVRRENS